MPVLTQRGQVAVIGSPQHRPIRIVDARTSMEHLVTDESVVAHRQAGGIWRCVVRRLDPNWSKQLILV
ncbi:MAG: hypothetical protein ACRDSM_11740 [Pseudonocardiaceae bacterium]